MKRSAKPEPGADSGETLDVSVAENLNRSRIEQPALEISRALVAVVSRSQRPEFLSVDDLPATHPAHRSLTAIGSTSVICVPISHSGELTGVLYLDGAQLTREARPALIRLLEILSSQAAAALHNAAAHLATHRALESAEERLRRHRDAAAHRPGMGDLVGSSQAMQKVYQQLEQFLATEESVMVLGETGTGKELVARLIHDRGARGQREFVAINCASLSETLLESELFGYERGAFTGAHRARSGLLELAHRGTLFLDEVGDMSPRMQADLLRVLQSGEVRRVGSREFTRVSVRIIAATHRDLEEMIRRGEFRQDLYYRLNVLTIRLPPLRDRSGDIPGLVETLMPRVCSRETVPTFSAEAMARLIRYRWPGNVRELENVLRRVLALNRTRIRVQDLPDEFLTARAEPAAGTLRQAETDAIRRALKESCGNKARAARILGIHRATLHAKLKLMESP